MKEISHSRRLAAASGLYLAVVSPALGAEHTFDGVYSGKRVLAKGSDPLCLAGDKVSVTINGGTLTFTDSILKDFLQPFYPSQDGSFGENYTYNGGSTYYQGRIVGDVMDIDVTNPPCEYHWHLKKE